MDRQDDVMTVTDTEDRQDDVMILKRAAKDVVNNIKQLTHDISEKQLNEFYNLQKRDGQNPERMTRQFIIENLLKKKETLDVMLASLVSEQPGLQAAVASSDQCDNNAAGSNNPAENNDPTDGNNAPSSTLVIEHIASSC